MPTPEPLIVWPKPILELAGFLALFLAAGAVGFWWSVLGRSVPAGDGAERALYAGAERRAAALGLLGAVISFGMFARRIPEIAERNHQTAVQFLATPAGGLQFTLLLLAVVGLALALSRARVGWWLAAAALVFNAIRPMVFSGWTRVNSAHELAGGLWIGTLFMLVLCGLAPLLRAPIDSARRGELAAKMVNAFSPLALASSGFLVLLGLITAWNNLKRIESLWTTPYGTTLLWKLAWVAAVFSLGAWNWRRQKPRMGTEAGARALRRSATAELAIAGVVLLITAMLVSLPSPK